MDYPHGLKNLKNTFEVGNSFELTSIPTRRFGRTEIEMPILSLGGMRFQQSWKDIPSYEISNESQKGLERILSFSISSGLHHIETARHYGTSELQLGWALNKLSDPKRILQTKIPPRDDPNEFEKELQLSFQRMQCERLDLLAIHGLNLKEHLDQTIRPGGCMEVVRRWQQKGKIGHVGFSTHGSKDLIIQAIQTNQFDYINLHWYFIKQENNIALDVAKQFDLGVFIISPTDKGGHLHSPSNELINLCAPIHPIIFNDLFCLRDHRVHTISVGVSQINDFEHHLGAIKLLDEADQLVPLIEKRLNEAAINSLGNSWLTTWEQGLPDWQNTPGNMNLPVLLWLHNLIEAWDMVGYSKARYALLGNGGHWFPGANADSLDKEVTQEALESVLLDSPWRKEIPGLLRKTRNKLITGKVEKRLSDA